MEEKYEKMKIEMWFLEYKIVKRQGYGSNDLNQWSWITFVHTLWYDL